MAVAARPRRRSVRPTRARWWSPARRSLRTTGPGQGPRAVGRARGHRRLPDPSGSTTSVTSGIERRVRGPHRTALTQSRPRHPPPERRDAVGMCGQFAAYPRHVDGAVGPPEGAGIERPEEGGLERGVLVTDPRVDQLVHAEPGEHHDCTLSAPHRTGQGPTPGRLRAVGPHVVLPPDDPSRSCHRHHVPVGLFARRRSADAARVRRCSHPISSSKGTWIAGRFRANHVGR
jgi:hypothetical protein